MDRNADGVISREEWRGTDETFRTYDWNNDGILSGDELRPGAQGRARRNDSIDSLDEARDFTPTAFTRLDDNRDGRLSRDEWPYTVASFRRVDQNDDNLVSRREFLIEGDSPNDRTDGRFSDLDRDRNGVISRNEWEAGSRRFDTLDDNGDGVLSRAELNRNPLPAEQSQTHATESAAYKAGFARGLAEGRTAGHEDKERHQGWDLDGQRELEQADSGYTSNLGSREEYQAGYREAFRRGYHEGFGPRT